MSEVKVPEGYKQTEVEVIPEDWKVTTIGDFAPLQRGFDLPTTKVEAGDYPVVYSNGIVRNHKDFQVKGAGIVTGRSGTIGKVHYIESDFWPHNTTLWVTSFGDAHVKFVYYLFKYIGFERFKSGSGVPTLNRNDAHSFKITVPTKVDEQTAIATALSDIDNLIQSLEKLIAKKEAIKTGAMQQLLTGKTRLPEFATREDGNPKGFRQTELGRIPEDWEVKAIAKIVKDSRIPSGLYKDKNSYATGAGTSIIKLGDVFSSNIFDPKSAQRVNVDKSEIERYKVEIGDLIIALASVKLEGVGKVMHVTTLEEETIYDHNVALIRTINNVSSSFLSYTFHSNYFRSLVASKATQVGTTFLKASTILGFELHLPSIKEQNAIAFILSDMDAEIQALQERLDKTRDIKQGMMQQLLTGKVRLAH